MKNLIKKVSAVNSMIINQVMVGNRIFTVVEKDNTLRGILDGSEILVSAEDSLFLERMPRIIKAITEGLLGGGNKSIKVKINKVGGVGEAISEKLLEELNSSGMRVKNMRNFAPIYPEYDLSTPIDYRSVVSKVDLLLNTLENITQILEISTNDSLVLTKRKLIDTMWGADRTQEAIDAIRSELLKVYPESDRLNLYYGLIRKSVSRLKVLHNRKDQDSLKIINNIIIPDVINNFESIKRFASDLFFIMSPIVHIDEIFIKNTTYPAKFFLPMDTIEAVEDDYSLIVEFLNKVPSIEQEVLNPLDLLRYNSKNIG